MHVGVVRADGAKNHHREKEALEPYRQNLREGDRNPHLVLNRFVSDRGQSGLDDGRCAGKFGEIQQREHGHRDHDAHPSLNIPAPPANDDPHFLLMGTLCRGIVALRTLPRGANEDAIEDTDQVEPHIEILDFASLHGVDHGGIIRSQTGRIDDVFPPNQPQGESRDKDEPHQAHDSGKTIREHDADLSAENHHRQSHTQIQSHEGGECGKFNRGSWNGKGRRQAQEIDVKPGRHCRKHSEIDQPGDKANDAGKFAEVCGIARLEKLRQRQSPCLAIPVVNKSREREDHRHGKTKQTPPDG